MTTSTTSNSTGQKLIETIVSEDDSLRHRSLSSFCESRSLDELLKITAELDSFWRNAPSLYHRVRAMFFLSAIYRYELPTRLSPTSVGLIPHGAHEHLLSRRFVEAIDELLE
ncbi:MAG: hypothetical protein RLY14_1808, partial [Planctomycetota bacterium]